MRGWSQTPGLGCCAGQPPAGICASLAAQVSGLVLHSARLHPGEINSLVAHTKPVWWSLRMDMHDKLSNGDLVNSTSRCCFVLQLVKVSFKVYLSSNLLRLEDSCQIPSGSIPVGSFLWVMTKMLLSFYEV
ncbi:embryonic stem cell-related gene protein-like [Chlorocebus sabaeus]|uniref:embryonic stem cell-related gene protein-like n=1 Tax=Chlorocebus sabaeus TaxID=60711 RepID=UPI003BF9F1B8